jgi:two-component system cell cycle sensor histidine kinase/response regulator CckA
MSEVVGIFPPSLEQDPIRRALDCLPEGFQIIDSDWRFVYLNPAAARHGRRDAKDITGKRMADEYPGIDRTPLFAVLRTCMEERTSRVIENQFTFPDGSTRWFELRIQPVPVGICIYSLDIEARKRRQPLAQRIRNLFR